MPTKSILGIVIGLLVGGLSPAYGDLTNRDATLLCFSDRVVSIAPNEAGIDLQFSHHAAIYRLDPHSAPEVLALARRSLAQATPLYVSVQVAGQQIMRLSSQADPRCVVR